MSHKFDCRNCSYSIGQHQTVKQHCPFVSSTFEPTDYYKEHSMKIWSADYAGIEQRMNSVIKPIEPQKFCEMFGELKIVGPLSKGDKLEQFLTGKWEFTEVAYDENTGIIRGKIEKVVE